MKEINEIDRKELKRLMNNFYGKLAVIKPNMCINMKDGKSIIIDADTICSFEDGFISLKHNEKIVYIVRIELIDSIFKL
jgi:hypothetical protein